MAVLLVAAGCARDHTRDGEEPAASTPSPPAAAPSGPVSAGNPSPPARPPARTDPLAVRRRQKARIASLEQAAQRDSSLPVLLQLADAYTGAYRFDEADVVLQRALAAAPDQPVALRRRALIWIQRGEVDQAIQWLQTAIQARPAYLGAYYDLGRALKFKGLLGPAYTAFEKVLQLRPASSAEAMDQADALYQIATIDNAGGDYERAEAHLRRLLQRVPEHPRAHYARAQALIHLGRVQEAQRELTIHSQLLAQQARTGAMAPSP